MNNETQLIPHVEFCTCWVCEYGFDPNNLEESEKCDGKDGCDGFCY